MWMATILIGVVAGALGIWLGIRIGGKCECGEWLTCSMCSASEHASEKRAAERIVELTSPSPGEWS